jgi:hypothetical protein
MSSSLVPYGVLSSLYPFAAEQDEGYVHKEIFYFQFLSNIEKKQNIVGYFADKREPIVQSSSHSLTVKYKDSQKRSFEIPFIFADNAEGAEYF